MENDDSDDDFVNKIVSLEQSEETLGMAAGRADASKILQKVRSGAMGLDELCAYIRDEASNAFAPYRFRGFVAVLHAELSKQQAA